MPFADPGPKKKVHSTKLPPTIKVELTIDCMGDITPGRLAELVMRAVETEIQGVSVRAASAEEVSNVRQSS